MYAVGLLFLLVGLAVSVGLHELGHLLPAKKFGAMVPEYWIGFGAPLFSRRFGDTTYGAKAVPLGGYVRIVGMYPPRSFARKPNTRVGGMVEEAREQSAQDVTDARAAGLTGKPFYQLGTAQKLVVMFGGPFMNLALAFFLTALIVMGVGWNEGTTTVAQVAGTNAELGVAGPGRSPASAAGILPGDTIVQWGQAHPETWEEAREAMGATPKEGTTVVVERAGAPVELYVTPAFAPDGTARIGVVAELARVKGSLGDSLAFTGTLLKGTGEAIIRLPITLWELGRSFFTGAERDPDGVVSIVGVARVAGEVSSLEGEGTPIPLVDRLAVLVSLLASLNVALFLFNLLPLPPLDGGHIAGAAWGGAKNLHARALGRPRPPAPDTARMVPLAYGVFAALIALTVVLVAADIFKPIRVF